MQALRQVVRQPRWMWASVLVVLLAGCATMKGGSDGAMMGNVTLSGSQEVPPVNTAASGKGNILVTPDKAVSGSVTTSGVVGTAAHIHMAAMGQNGPVIIPLTKSGDTYSVPAGAKLNDAQYDAWKAGNLYVNVHSDAHKGGEIRGQLKP